MGWERQRGSALHAQLLCAWTTRILFWEAWIGQVFVPLPLLKSPHVKLKFMMWGAVRSLWVQSWGFQSLLFNGTPWSCLGQCPSLGHSHRIQEQVQGTAPSHLRKMQVSLSLFWSPGTSLGTSDRMLCCVLGSFPSETAAWGKAFHMQQLPAVTSHHVIVTYINFTPNKRGDNTWGHNCILCGKGTAHGKQSGGKACVSLSYFDLFF